MPELPDVTVYVEALERFVLGQPLAGIRLGSPFLLRTVDPPLSVLTGRPVRSVRRLGKRIVLGFDDALYLVIHLMIAGRLRWRPPGMALPKKWGLAYFDFPEGSVLFSEAGTKRRASLHLLRGDAALAAMDRGGLEVMTASLGEFTAALTRENHTLKRALTDPRLFSGIGNAYSDEILHRARLSPLRLTRQLSLEETARLHAATQGVLAEWTDRLRAEVGDDFPEEVTAFRPGMAVHGRYREPCPDCGMPVQRIVYAENETNYCARCQNEGRMLADRSLSRLLKDDWPATIDEWDTGE